MLNVTFQMKTAHIFPLTALIFSFVLLSNNAPAVDARVTQSFDAGWRFLKADATGAEQNQFEDSAWRKLDVPHDWSIEGPFDEANQTGTAGGFLPAGIGWYRKHFMLPEGSSNRCVFIEFDGVMANSDVWINGFHLGKRPFGYVSFSYELTGHLNFDGKENVLSVRVDNSVQPALRWYAGAGIYRHVRLVATDAVHIVKDGVFISTPQITATQATVHVQCTVTNESDFQRPIVVTVDLRDLSGKEVGWSASDSQTVLSAGKSAQFNQDIIVTNPQLWNLDKPVLYRALVAVVIGQKDPPNGLVFSMLPFPDLETNTFGIRDAHFEPETGFWLNGKNFKLKGAAIHTDGGAFGAAVPLGVWEQRLAELRKVGVNALRLSHNPPTPELLDLCDRMGFLVMDEMFDVWTVGKSSLSGQRLADYHLIFNEWSSVDTADTVRRDRNHPSVILYSAGNEIHDTPNAALSIGILTRLVKVFHENDPTRPVTQALFRPNQSHDYDDGLADLLDVVGTNYRDTELLAAQRAKPTRKILGTEITHDRASWLAMRDNPSYSGQFIWTGIDYLGESRAWPVVVSGSGFLDRTGTMRPIGRERQSWWSDVPMVSIARRIAAPPANDPSGAPAADRRPQTAFGDWTPKNSSPHDENVDVYSNCKEVELFFNGESLGVKPLNVNAAPRTWRVPYAPGTLKAVAKNDGKIVATDEIRTAGAPAKILLTPDAATVANGWDGVVRVVATVEDKGGTVVPDSDALVSFKISGPGVIAAVDNANNASHELFQASERRAFQGRCVAFLKATASSGKITLTASAPGLTASPVAITIAEPSPAK
jgi:beta-galactosidase